MGVNVVLNTCVTTKEQNRLYESHVKELSSLYRDFAVKSIYYTFRDNFSRFFLSLIVQEGRDEIILHKERLKNTGLAVILENYKDNLNTNNKSLMKELQIKLATLCDSDEKCYELSKLLDEQACMKSLRFRKSNLTVLCKKYNKKEKDVLAICNKCICLRNMYMGHGKAEAYMNWTTTDLREIIMKPIRNYIAVFSQAEIPELKKLAQEFDQECENSLHKLGYPPIDIEDFADEYGFQKDELLSFAKNRRFTVNGQYILETNKEDFLKEYQELHPDIKMTADTKKPLKPLKYLLSLNKARLDRLQRMELLTLFNIVLDASVLMKKDSLEYLAYEIRPILEEQHRMVFIDRSTRAQIHYHEKYYKSLKDCMTSQMQEADFDPQEYASICEEYERAKAARNFMNLWKKKNLVKYFGKGDSLTQPDENMEKLLKMYQGRRFVIFTQNKEQANDLLQLANPNLLAVRIFTNEALFVWKDFLPCASGYQETSLGEKIETTPEVTKKVIQQVVKKEEIPEKKEPVQSLHPSSVKAREVEKKEKVENRIEEAQTSGFRLEKEAIQKKDKVIRLNGSIPKEYETAFTRDRKQVRLLELLGEGGEGRVYRTDHTMQVAKIYAKHRITRHRKQKLELMTLHNPHIQEVCWPGELLYNEQQEFIGYMMPEAGTKSMEIGESVMKIGSQSVHDKYLKSWNRLDLVKVAHTICKVFENLHKRNILIGDINVRNILIYPDDSSIVRFVDCDSYQVGQYPCPVGIKLVAPSIYKRANTVKPDFEKIMRTKEDEEYSLASLIFQILMLGQAPYASKEQTADVLEAMMNYTFSYRSNRSGNTTGKNVPVGPFRMIWSNTPSYIKNLFEDVFTGKKTYKAEEWERRLFSYMKDLENGKFTKELKPKKYFAKGFEDNFVDFTCECCHEEANIPKERYDDLKSRNFKIVCNDCQAFYNRLRKKSCILQCSRCKSYFQSNDFMRMLQEQDGKSVYCPSCKENRR